MLLNTMESGDIQPPLVLDKSSFIPYYRQIFEQVRDLIESGEVLPGRIFWAQGNLARELGISKMTVHQAFQSLRADGLLVIEKGKRPVVGARPIYKNFQKLRGFSEEMARRGMKPSSRLLSIERREPDTEIRKTLQLDSKEQIYRIERLRFADGDLVGLETSSLPARLFTGIDLQDLERQSLYSLLEGCYGMKLEWSEEALAAIPAGPKEAKLLRVRAGSPLFSMQRTVYSDKNIPIEYGLSLLRGDRYRAAIISHRKP